MRTPPLYHLRWLIVLLSIALPAPRAYSEPAAPATRPASGELLYTYTQPDRDTIGKRYMGREISNVMGHAGARWLERPEREKEEGPARAIELMGLKPTDVVADIGAGTGYFSFRMAAKVPQGKVLAEDIEEQMLDDMRRKAAKTGVTNVVPVLGTVADPKLPDNSVDVALMVDSYHEFDHPREMMLAIVKALKPGGRVIDIEYRGEEPKPGEPEINILPHHKMTEAQAIKEMTAVGLRHVKTYEDLPQQHLMIFEKPPAGNLKSE
jgi:ubiquinone/menaquinone biosynthesis C-methylase UbiE